MYSYDRTKTARRAVGEAIQSVEEALRAAREAVGVANQFLKETEELFGFLQVKFDQASIRDLIKASTLVIQDLPVVLTAIDRLDDAVDGYARKVRKTLPHGHKDLTVSDLDRNILREFKQQAKVLLKKLVTIREVTEDAPTGFEIEEYYDSPKIGAINRLASRLDELSSDMTFDSSDLETFLEGIEDLVLERVNG